jgi:hypothetical protein
MVEITVKQEGIIDTYKTENYLVVTDVEDFSKEATVFAKSNIDSLALALTSLQVVAGILEISIDETIRLVKQLNDSADTIKRSEENELN